MSRHLTRPTLAAHTTPSATVARARLLAALSHDRAASRLPSVAPAPRAAAPQVDLLSRLLAQEPGAPGERP